MKVISSNKKAFFDYEILDSFEAGIILSGAEVKSCRSGRVNLKGSYLEAKNNEIVVEKMHISPYQAKNQPDYDPLRPRKLLLNKKEIKKITEKIHEKGITAVPLEMILKNQFIKLKIALCRGKKKYDKRENLKKKGIDREVKKALKRY